MGWYISTTVSTLGDKCKILIPMHVISDCDTVSFLNGKGKPSTIKVLCGQAMPELNELVDENAAQVDLLEAGTKFAIAMYQETKADKMNDAWYNMFRNQKNQPPLKCLPPTSQNHFLHTLCAHLQFLL